MMYNLFLLIFGCLKIEISGSEIEKFLNKAAKQRIPIKDLRYKNKAVSGNISPKHLLRLKNARKGIDVKLKILKKSGILFKLKPHRERVGFIVGFVLFLLILKFLSLFVWQIRISGNNKVKNAEITAVCSSLGIKNGVMQSCLDPKTLADKILMEIPRLTWVSVNIENCVVTVNVSEAERTEEYKQKSPSNLIAGESGTITKINVVSGETTISVGDNILKGDILVSGVTKRAGSHTFINSSGQVFAEVIKTYTESEELKSVKYTASGKKTKRAVTFLWFKIPLYLGKTKTPCKVKVKTNNLTFFGTEIPISISEGEFTLYKKKNVTYTEGELEKILNKRIDKKIADEIKDEYEIISSDTAVKDNKMTVTKTVKTTENIAIEVPIDIE